MRYITKIYLNLVSIFNCIYLNFKINFFEKNEKYIFFYFLKSAKDEDLKSIENYLKKYKKFKVIYGSTHFLKSNYFIIKPLYLKMVFGLKIFMSNYVCDNFPWKTENYYLHHDIYDTPLLEKKKEYGLVKRLSFYNQILIPSSKSLKVFNKLFLKAKKKPKIRIIGEYPKLTYIEKFYKKSERINLNNNCVIIAPSGIRGIPKLSMRHYFEKVISLLLKENFKVIFRPHPSDRNSKEILDIREKFKKDSLFTLDFSSSYIKKYLSSSLMITDYSGTAYTYSMITLNPVVFFSINEKYIHKLKYNKLDYFIDRKKVGLISYNLKDVVKKIKLAIKHKKKYSRNILEIKNHFFFNSSKNEHMEF